jgi:suppressor of G2 allele of SKP1
MGDYEKCIETLTKLSATSDQETTKSESLDYARHFLLGKAYFLNSENDKALIELYRAKDQA